MGRDKNLLRVELEQIRRGVRTNEKDDISGSGRDDLYWNGNEVANGGSRSL